MSLDERETQLALGLRRTLIRYDASYFVIEPRSPQEWKDAAALGVAQGWVAAWDMAPMPEIRYRLTQIGFDALQALPDVDPELDVKPHWWGKQGRPTRWGWVNPFRSASVLVGGLESSKPPVDGMQVLMSDSLADRAPRSDLGNVDHYSGRVRELNSSRSTTIVTGIEVS